MDWLKEGIWKAGGAFGGVLLLLSLVMWFQISAADAQQTAISELATPIVTPVQATATEDATVTALNKEKLLLDVDQQLHTMGNWLWNNGAAIISSLVLVLAGVFTVFRYLSDQSQEREKQRIEHQIEREKRAEERFQAAVTALGDEHEGTRIGAVILLRTFLHPDYEQYHVQIFDLVVANLRLPRTAHQPEDASLPQTMTPFSPESLDASRTQLDKAYLSRAGLKQAWLPGADLNEADLSKAYLSKIYLRNAGLRAANLSGADLETALSLRDADLRQVIGLT